MKPQNLIISVICILIVLSCKKDKNDSGYTFAGTYNCSIHHYYSAPDTLIKDTTYQGQLEIGVVDTNAIITENTSITNQIVSAEILNSGYVEWINPNGLWGLSHAQLVGDSIYSRIYIRNKFGNLEYKDYSGLKQ